MSTPEEKIVVAGYPKSGTTWVCRLLGQLLGCPVRGRLGDPDRNAVQNEGLDRDSSLQVLKSHHQYSELSDRIPLSRLVYVVRDVRDIVVSGAHYFPLFPNSHLGTLLQTVDFKGVISNCFLNGLSRNINMMIRIVSNGDKNRVWRHVPWDIHVNGYLEAEACVVQYEDLLADAATQCERFSAHLGYHPSPEEIQTAVREQSFQNVKRKFQSRGDAERAQFLRSGSSGEWRRVLTEEEQDFLRCRFRNTLETLGYVDTQAK